MENSFKKMGTVLNLLTTGCVVAWVLNLSWSDAGHPEDAKPWQWWSMMMKNRRQVVRRPLLILLRRHWPSVSIRRRLICTVTVMWTVQGRDTLYLLILKILIYLIMGEREKD